MKNKIVYLLIIYLCNLFLFNIFIFSQTINNVKADNDTTLSSTFNQEYENIENRNPKEDNVAKKSRSLTKTMFQTVFALLFVILIFVAFIYALKYGMNKLSTKNDSNEIKLLAQKFLSPKLQIFLFEAEGFTFLVGTNDNNILLLHKRLSSEKEESENTFKEELSNEISEYDRMDELDKEIRELKKRLENSE